MPIYEYTAIHTEQGCDHCRNTFEHLEKIAGPRLHRCPHCGAEVRRVLSAPAVGRSQSGFDDRARNAGFHKLQKISKGEYEKKY
jgi:putative FmdB family regulatory protein